MIARIVLIASLAGLAVPAAAQQVCATKVGVCTLNNSAPGSACACFTQFGVLQGVAGPKSMKAAISMVPAGPAYCCTAHGKIGPLQNNGTAVGQACSVVLPTGVPAAGTACK